MKTKITRLAATVAALFVVLAMTACNQYGPPQPINAGPAPCGAGPAQPVPGPQGPGMHQPDGRPVPQVVATPRTVRTGPVRAEGAPSQANEFYRVPVARKKYLIGADGSRTLVETTPIKGGQMEKISPYQVPATEMAKIQSAYQRIVQGQQGPPPRQSQPRR